MEKKAENVYSTFQFGKNQFFNEQTFMMLVN